MKENQTIWNVEAVAFDADKAVLTILDQTALPSETVFLHLSDQQSIWNAIFSLQVRGAPAIGITAAYGVYLAALQIEASQYEDFYSQFMKAKKFLASARPTAVNLFWALDRMERCVLQNQNRPVAEIKICLLNEAEEIKAEDVRVCRSIGEHGLSLLQPNMGILTHCNAGHLATGKYGTALAPIYLGYEKGYNLRVFADETRPLLQGARLTAYELYHAGVDVTLICDNMATIVMKKGWVQAVLVGCDRVAANGDTANKIGTSGVAILAKEYNIPFYVCAPTATIDPTCQTGEDIHIEERDSREISESWFQKPMTVKGVKIYNPAFDITDAKYITAIITEFGIVYPPFDFTPHQA